MLLTQGGRPLPRQGEGQKGRKRLGQQPSHVTSGSARYTDLALSKHRRPRPWWSRQPPTPKLSLQTHPIANRYSRLRRSPRPPRPSSTCSRSRTYLSGGQGSLTLKTADGRLGSVLRECSDRFGIVSSSRFLLSRAYTSRNLGLARSPGLA
jgi:hypothetical protein